MPYKVCVYAICKDEEMFVDRWMDAVQEADLVVVADTGSTDKTVEKLRARGALVFEETISPWRFDTARNAAMDHIPDDVDICVSNDLDEVFDTGWRKKLEAAWQPYHTRAAYWFAWRTQPDGTPQEIFKMEKIHRRRGFRWVHPVHEVLAYTGTDPDCTVFVDDILLRHFPDEEKSRGFYLPLLELSAKENPTDDRTMFWLGREYLYQKNYDQAIKTLQHHLKLPGAVWDEERSAAMRYIASAYRAKGNPAEAQRWLLRAAGECPKTREPWAALALFGYETANWHLVYFAVEKGLAITQKTNSYLTESENWGPLLADLGATACYWLGLYPQALAFAEAALALSAADERLKGNREKILKKINGVAL